MVNIYTCEACQLITTLQDGLAICLQCGWEQYNWLEPLDSEMIKFLAAKFEMYSKIQDEELTNEKLGEELATEMTATAQLIDRVKIQISASENQAQQLDSKLNDAQNRIEIAQDYRRALHDLETMIRDNSDFLSQNFKLNTRISITLQIITGAKLTIKVSGKPTALPRMVVGFSKFGGLKSIKEVEFIYPLPEITPKQLHWNGNDGEGEITTRYPIYGEFYAYYGKMNLVPNDTDIICVQIGGDKCNLPKVL